MTFKSLFLVLMLLATAFVLPTVQADPPSKPPIPGPFSQGLPRPHVGDPTIDALLDEAYDLAEELFSHLPAACVNAVVREYVIDPLAATASNVTYADHAYHINVYAPTKWVRVSIRDPCIIV